MGRLRTAFSRAMRSGSASSPTTDWLGFALGALITAVAFGIAIAGVFGDMPGPVESLSAFVAIVGAACARFFVERVRPETGRGAYILGVLFAVGLISLVFVPMFLI